MKIYQLINGETEDLIEEFSSDNYSNVSDKAIELANRHGVEISVCLDHDVIDYEYPDGTPWDNVFGI